ncbi:hypothetical protein EDC32_102665 [Laceyella sacchari]|nr:hypothetical protein EDC32_102665 [Laceyella sacchari]
MCRQMKNFNAKGASDNGQLLFFMHMDTFEEARTSFPDECYWRKTGLPPFLLLIKPLAGEPSNTPFHLVHIMI